MGFKMLPMWKAKRELLRAMDHAKFPFIALSSPLLRSWHDKRKVRSSRYTAGQLTAGSNVVLYLLYQPKAILASSIKTLRHFATKGFSVFIVSNAPLSESDRDTLCGLSFGILERENYGYDFGGYRDGILHLLDNGVQMDRLLIMNDSVWFPTFADEDFLDNVLVAKTDLYGAVLSQRKKHIDERHLQSYAVSFGKKLLEQTVFAKFWRQLAVGNNRQWTIRSCELRMTRYFDRLGFSISARWDFTTVATALSKLTDNEIKSVLKFELELGAKRLDDISAILARSGQLGWRQSAEAYINSKQFRKYILLLHPDLQKVMNFPFAKKSRETYYSVHRASYSRFMADRCSPSILSELSHWD